MNDLAPLLQPGHGLADDPDMIRRGFEKGPFLVEHRLCDHPLLQMPRLIELAAALPASEIEFNHADIPLDQDYLLTPGNGLSVAETLKRIDDCHSWVVLKHIEYEAAYRDLLLECVEPLRPLTRHIAPGMYGPEAYVFVSSPGAVTPFHCDPEHNFLLQIRGDKQMAVFNRDNSAVVTQPQLEGKVNGAHRNLPFSDDMHRHQALFHLTPGKGLHVPMHCPHWVRVNDAVSVSLSITFRSRASERREGVLRFNSRVRKLGLSPTRPGQGVLNDELKYFVDRVIRRSARWFRR